MVEDLMQEKTGVHVAETTSDQQPEPALQGGTSISTSESLPNVDSIMLPFLEESQPDSFMHMFDGDLSNWLGGRDLMNGSSQATSSVLSGRLIKNEGVKVEGAPWPGSHFQQGGDLLSMSGVNADESSQRPSSVSSSRLIKAEKLAFDENARQNSQAQRLSTPASRVGSAASRAWNGIEAAVATAAQRPSTAFSRPSTSQTVTTNDSSVLAAAKSTFFHNLRETPPPSFRRSSQPVSLKGRFADEEPSLSQMFKNVLTLLPREDRMDQSFNVKSVDIESSNSKRPSSTVSGRARTPKSPWTRVPGDFDDKASCAGSVASSTQWSVGGDSVTPHDSVSQVGVSKDRDIPMNEIPPPQPTPAHPNKLFGITELASALKSSPTRSSSVTPRDSFLKGSHVKLEEPNTSNRNVTLMPSAMSSRSPQSTSKLSFSKTSVSSSSKALSKSHYVTFLPSYEDDDILDTPSSSSGFISKPSLQMKPGAANDVEMVIERAPMVETNPSGSAANVSQQSPSGTKFTAEQQATSATTPWSKLSHHSQIRRLKLATADAASNVESPSLSSRIDRPNSSSTKGKRLWSNADIHSSPIHARSSSESGMRESYGNQPAIKRLRSMELGEARPSTHSGRFHIVDDERRGRSLEPVATPHGMRRSGSAPPDVAGEDEPQTSGDRRAEGAGAAGHGGDMMDLGDDKIMGRDGIENATNRSSQATENKRKRRAVIEDEDDEELRQREELLRYYKEKKASSEMSIDSHAQGKKRNRRGHVIAEEEEGDEQKQLFNAKNCAKRQTSAMSIDSMDFQSKVENSRRSGGMARDPDFRVVTPLSTTSSTSMDSLQFQQQPRRTVRFQSQLSYAQSPRTLPTDDMSSIATSELTDAVDGDAKGEGALAGANVGLDETVKDKIILCISFKHRSLGCAYYSVFHSTLYLMEDMEENDQFELVKMLIYQIAPTTIVTHARVDEAFMDILKAASQESGGRARQGAKPNVEIRPSTDFSYATAKTRLLSIRLSEKTARAQNSNIPPGMNPPNIMNEEHDVDRSANVGRKGEVPPFRFATSTASNVQSERTEMYLYLEGIVSLQCKEMVGCAGALLSYISKMRLTGEILEDDDVDPMDQDDDEDDENDTSIFGPKSRRPKKNRASKNEILSKFMEIHAVEQFSLKRYMHVNADTLCSLQIFQDEAHPNMHSSRSKEGLSLFGILDMTHTAPGRFLLKRWFLRPSLDIEALRRRHDTIEAFMRPENGHIVESVRSSLKHVKNIPKILFSMRTKVSVTEWQALLRFCFYTLKIRSSIRDMTEMNLPIMKKIEEAFVVQELKDVGSFINNVIDFDQSIAEGRVSVKPFIDDELDELKRNYHGLDDLLSQVARIVSAELDPAYGQSLNVIYFPQLGYLITIPLREEMQEKEDFLIEGLTFQFCTHKTIYYKNDRMFELDETLGDIHSMIVDREIEILQRLQEAVLDYDATLRKCSAVCAELDCLLALTEAAKKYRLKRPTMTEENVLHIEKGRHPLQELCVDVFVPNDTHLGDPPKERKAMLLTGANFSGKSIYLKQVALITYMAHIGSFVPAERATIGLTDKIFTRVQTRETVSKIQSAFMIDLHQVAVAIRNSTPRSLILFDEFGKGTLSTDGVGLFAAVLDHLVQRGADCPKVIAATHFHEIFAHKLLSKNQLLLEATMDIMQDPRSEDGLTFLYRVVSGRATSSWGIHCARLAGLPPHVIKRGEKISQALSRGEIIATTADPLAFLSSANQDLDEQDPVQRRRMAAALGKKRAAEEVSSLFAKFDCRNGDLKRLFGVIKSIAGDLR